MIAHLDGDFDGRRAVVREEAAVESGGREAHQSFRERDGGLMGEAGEDHMLEPVELLAHRRVDPRVGMAEEIHPPGADGIEIAPAFEVLEPHALATPDRDHRQLLVILHLRARMPHVREIAGDERGVVFAGSVHGAGLRALAGSGRDCGMIIGLSLHRPICMPAPSLPVLRIDLATGLLAGARQVISPNFDERPSVARRISS